MDVWSAISRNGVPVRLTEERWEHIRHGHPELQGYQSEIARAVEEPDALYEGSQDEMIALLEIPTGKALVVIYREIGMQDGLIITAYLTRRSRQLRKRKKIWPPQP